MKKILWLATVAYTILLITRPQEFVPALANLPLLQVILLGAFAVWVFVPDKGIDVPQFALMPVFLFCVWLSLGLAGWWGGIVPALERLLPPILLFVILTGSVRTIIDLRRFSFVLIACTAILVLHGHLQRTTGSGWTGQPMIDGRITYSGIFNDPNDLGLLIVLAMALSIYLLRTSRSSVARLLAYGAIGWLLYGVYLADSRGTMLAVLAVLGLDTWRTYGKTVVIFAALCAIPVLLAFTRLAELDADEASAGGRIEAWYEGIQMLIDNPVFGVGWGMFSDYNPLTAHNSFILAMGELGLLGYTIWFALILITGWMILKLAFPAETAESASQQGLPREADNWAARQPVEAAQMWRSDDSAPRPDTDEPRGFRRSRILQAGPATTESATANVGEERLAARALLFAAIGFLIGAFFLSQAYKAMLFINCGLIVGRYLGMRDAGLVVPRFTLVTWLPISFVCALGSVIAIWLPVRLLL